MRGTTGALIILVFSLLAINTASAYGYGTSSVSMSRGSASVPQGGGSSVNYTVNLASGNTWGTTLSVVNNNQLSSQGIMVSLSNPSGDPPFSGTMAVTTSSSTPAGTYNVTLAAAGDDPSTSNADYMLTVLAPATTVQTTTVGSGNKTTTAQQTTSQATTSVQQTATVSGTGGYYGSGNAAEQLASSALIILIILGALYGLFVWKSTLTRLVVIGTALMLTGIIAWLYGDYAGGIQSYIWGGFAGILVGTAAWVYGDIRGGTFKRAVAGKLSLLGIVLILIGLIGWAYGELYAPGVSSYWWGGTVLLVIGTIAWLYGDLKAGAFLRRKG